jgi:hypothetical protein
MPIWTGSGTILPIVADFVPNTSNAYDLGVTATRWKNLWLAGNATIAGTLALTGALTLPVVLTSAVTNTLQLENNVYLYQKDMTGVARKVFGTSNANATNIGDIDTAFSGGTTQTLNFYSAGVMNWYRGGVKFLTALVSSGDLVFTATSGGFGYATGLGVGGAVTQITDKTTGVTLNNICGRITLNAASLAATTAVSFTFTNSFIAATDAIILTMQSVTTAGAYSIFVDNVSAGSCRISLRNNTAGALAEALSVNYHILKGSIT